MIYKKFSIVHNVKLGIKYNINELTGMIFKNIGVFYTITKFKVIDKLSYHLDIEYNIQYPYITFRNKYSQYNIEAELTCMFFEHGSELYV